MDLESNNKEISYYPEIDLEIEKVIQVPFQAKELTEYTPKKNYFKVFNFSPFFDKNSTYNSTQKNWANLLSFLNVELDNDLENFINELKPNEDNIEIAKILLDGNIISDFGIVKELKYLIGYLVNRGPIILDDLFIYGVDMNSKYFFTSKGKKRISVIDKKLTENYGLSFI